MALKQRSTYQILQYNHRLGAIFFDAIHHEQIGKCSSRTRRNDAGDDESAATDALHQAVDNFDHLVETAGNETMYEYYDDDNEEEFKMRGVNERQRRILRLEGQCRSKYMDILKSKALEHCRKLGSWTKRASHLMNDLKIMRRSCNK